MRLDRHQGSLADRLAMDRALAALRDGCRSAVAPCTPTCPRATGRCCSPHCPDAATALSSDPANAPIETPIAPLVYQLRKLGVFQPFWSCGGHDSADGRLWKTPRVWFYTDDVIHVRVLADCLLALQGAAPLSCRWLVAATFCEPENTGAAFALEPAPDSGATLAQLRADARRIADALPGAIEAQLHLLARRAG